MKMRVAFKRLSNPRIRKRLKIAFLIFVSGIALAILFKVVYDIGYYDAQSLQNQKISELSDAKPVLTLDRAQRIVSGALKEDPNNPSTFVDQIVNDDFKLSTIIIENNKIKRVAWIIEMRLFFAGEIFNDEGYNLNVGIERQYNINRDNFNRGVQ